MSVIPESILAGLTGADPAERLAAVLALRELPATQPVIILLGRLAANDLDVGVRSAAVAALRSAEAWAAYASQAMLGETRLALIQQINRWQIAGSITSEQAEVLLLRYGYDFHPAPLSDSTRGQLARLIQGWSEQALVTPEQASLLANSLSPQAPAPAPASPPAAQAEKSAPKAREHSNAPPPSLSQILFSETSIRIALFLGGFLVVAAALILAALVELARMPVLLSLALVSGTGALVSRRRLPLPSFVLYIIFASSLPILARVVVDMLRLTGRASDTYWTGAWLLLALALAFGTRLYASRLMSFAALGGLVAAAYELAAVLPGNWRSLGLLLALSAILGVLGSRALLRWKDFHFALPLYLGVHLVAAAAMLYTFVYTLMDLFVIPLETPLPGGRPSHWLYFAFSWAAAAAFYALADRYVRRLALLPYLAAGALVLFPWTFAQSFTPKPILMAAVLAAVGAFYALVGAFIDQRAPRNGWLVRYGKPLMFAAPLLMGWSALIGLDEDVLAGFILLLASAVVLAALNVFRSRVWAWSVALVFGLLAYFVFFELPAIEPLHFSPRYIALLPGLLLLLPEFFRFTPQANLRWRLSARWLGLVVLGYLALAVLSLAFEADTLIRQEGVWTYAVMAVFFLALALRRKLPLIATASTILLTAALLLLLINLTAAHWLPWLVGLAILFYGVGAVLRGGHASWSSVFRLSAIGLAFLLLGRLPFEHDWLGGLFMLAAALLFLVELLWGPRSKAVPWLEAPLDALMIGALFGLLNPIYQLNEAVAWALGLLLAALIVLGLDLFFTSTSIGRQVGAQSVLRWGARTAGMLLAAGSLTYTILAADLPAGGAAALFAISAVYALLAARVYPLPRLGYAMVSYMALTLFYLLRALDQNIWLSPEIALAALLYAGSFLLQKYRSTGETPAAADWTEVLRYSGLGLALLISLTAPLEGSGLWASLWVACAATLYAVEAFRRRSVWWGFPTDGLYLLAYFLLLLELKVDQAQFFSVAVALLGMLQHYLLIRTGSRLGAFITGMVSQLVLLGTTYWQMTSTERLDYFVILFFQGLAVLVYGIILRSRSLVITPLVFIVLGVMTVVLSILSGVPTAIIIGCTGILLLALGILAVILRERLVEASEKMGGWRA